jgi:glycosyltransferase involved in cell wall biosynthesis
MTRCLESLLVDADDVEILIIDDGSTDRTGAIADCYAKCFPGLVRAVHQDNGGHGAAINTGAREATGRYIKIVDSDDWLDRSAYLAVLAALRRFTALDEAVDVVVNNFIYEKVGKRHKTAVRYRGVLPTGLVFSWDDVGRFGPMQYILMHSLIYRTTVLRDSGLRLPEHTFYVDNLYAYVPLTRVRHLYYLDVDLYRYYIGRADQSVNEVVMLRQADQYLRINKLMIAHLDRHWADPATPPALRQYMMHYARIVCATASILLNRAGTSEARAAKDQFWADLRRDYPSLCHSLRRSAPCQLADLPGRGGRALSVWIYRAARRMVGFN